MKETKAQGGVDESGLDITVIIPTYKPGSAFRELLKGLMSQTVAPKQVLIFNTQEEYFHPEDVEDIPNCRVVHISKEEFDHGGTRDRAARMCGTRLMVFMTMDAVPGDSHLLEELRKPFRDQRVWAAYARQLPAPDCSPLERFTRSFNYGPKSRIKTREDLGELGIKTFFCSNVCAAYRREDYLRLGGFERRTIFNEDMIFAGKIIQEGGAIAYCARARVIHSHNYTGLQQFKRNFDLGVSQADHPEVFGMAKSESEGVRMVAKTASWLAGSGQLLWLPRLVWQSGCKFAGYRMGKSYRKLPQGLIRRCTMNREYWRQNSAKKN